MIHKSMQVQFHSGTSEWIGTLNYAQSKKKTKGEGKEQAPGQWQMVTVGVFDLKEFILILNKLQIIKKLPN